MAAQRGTTPSYLPRLDIGDRANNALIAHGEDIVKPRDVGEKFQYEGELVAVFGCCATRWWRSEVTWCVGRTKDAGSGT
jgi:hypothetical protein